MGKQHLASDITKNRNDRNKSLPKFPIFQS